MPFISPVKPSPSSVVAFTLTWLTEISKAFAIFALIFSMCGDILGFCAMIVASILPIE